MQCFENFGGGGNAPNAPPWLRACYILTTCPYFDNHEFDIFDEGSLQCHFIMSFTIAVRIPTLSVQ